MPLEIILKTTSVPAVTIRTIDGDLTTEILADFGPLVVTASYGTPQGKYDPVKFPFTITHRASGLLVNTFPSLDLASCAARQWSAFNWDISFHEDRVAPVLLLEKMMSTAIFCFSGRKSLK